MEVITRLRDYAESVPDIEELWLTQSPRPDIDGRLLMAVSMKGRTEGDRLAAYIFWKEKAPDWIKQGFHLEEYAVDTEFVAPAIEGNEASILIFRRSGLGS
ncbi:MAG: hypothetical protein GC206_08435 [Alphaproteobacteria bacterium]|nr:hypothetical protein [Alphaproteobacteria bacterium]